MVGILCQSHLGYADLLLAYGRLGLGAMLLNPRLSGGQLAAVCWQKPLDLVICNLEFVPKVRGLELRPGGPYVALLFM